MPDTSALTGAAKLDILTTWKNNFPVIFDGRGDVLTLLKADFDPCHDPYDSAYWVAKLADFSGYAQFQMDRDNWMTPTWVCPGGTRANPGSYTPCCCNNVVLDNLLTYRFQYVDADPPIANTIYGWMIFRSVLDGLFQFDFVIGSYKYETPKVMDDNADIIDVNPSIILECCDPPA